MRPNRSSRSAPARRAEISRAVWPTLSALLLAGGCELAEVEIERAPDLVVAGVTIVLTVDPLNPSQAQMSALALVTRNRRENSYEEPGATVRIVGESGRSLTLREAPDPLSTCVTRLSDGNRPPAGSCYVASAPATFFLPGEQLTLLVRLADGSLLRGDSRIPGVFTPSGLSLKDGRCRLNPDTSYRFEWARAAGSWAYVAESKLAGLGELWPNDEPLYLPVTVPSTDATELVFPRDFLFELVDLQRWELHRVLRVGLPEGATAEVAVGAVDRNWATWIRNGRIDLTGEARIPSVFGDGTGWFGTAVRWKVSMESRAEHVAGAGNDLPLCGPPVD